LDDFIGTINLPQGLIEILASRMNVGVTLDVNLITVMTEYASIIISAVIIILAVGIVTFIGKHFVSKAIYGRPIGVFNRISGMVLYGILGALVICVALTITNMAIGLSNSKTAVGAVEFLNSGMFTQYIVKDNPIDLIIKLLITKA